MSTTFKAAAENYLRAKGLARGTRNEYTSTIHHYAHRAPLAFRTMMTLPQPTVFQSLVKGSGSECPCCRRRYADAG